MSFIDASYFVGELNIPNSGDPAVQERITLFIQKYEPIFFRQLLGYPLYKAFVTGMNVTPPATPNVRFLNILYGCEYTSLSGYLTQWKGLIITDSPIYNLAGKFTYKKPQYLTAGVTPDFFAGVNTASFPDWIGWTPIITRAGVMKPNVDYSFDIDEGELTLLKTGDKFGNNEDFFVQFELRTDDVPNIDLSMNESVIANFIYYWYYRSVATQSTGIGEVKTNAENAINDTPNQKMACAWNELSQRVEEFIEFMDTMTSTNPSLYPEWLWIHRYRVFRDFNFANPIF
jgi:hypothetical protein